MVKLNKKGEFTFITLSIILLITLILGGFVVGYVANIREGIRSEEGNSSSDFISSTSNTLTPIGEGITSAIIKTPNQTWLEFDGVNDYVNVSSFIMTNGTSYCFEVKFKNLIGSSGYSMDYGGIISKGFNQVDSIISFKNNTDNNLSVYFEDDAGSALESTTHSYELDKWYDYCLVYNDERKMAYYRDGVLIEQETASKSNITLGYIGQGHGNAINDGSFNGSYDNIKFYNYSLTLRQVQMHDYSSSRNLGRAIPILSYHKIEDPSDIATEVNISDFTAQMQFLNDSGIETITFKDYYNWRQGTFNMPKKAVILTFDDGWLSVYTNATPIMDTYGFVGAYGIIGNKVETSGYSNWTQIEELKNKGWEIYSHSMNTTSLLDLSESDRLDFFNSTKNMIEGNLSGYEVYTWVYPNNAHNDTTDTECGNYYYMCTGDSSGKTSPFYTYKGSDLIGGLNRLIVYNDTKIENYKQTIDEYYGLFTRYNLNENSGTTAYDSSGNNNHGTITGATWNTDGILNTLVSGVDYTLNTASGLLTLSSEYVYSWIESSWEYVNKTNRSDTIGLTLTEIFVALGILGIAILIANKYWNEI